MGMSSCAHTHNDIDSIALRQWQAGKTVTAEAVEAYGGVEKCFRAEPVPDGVWARMQGKTYKENPYIGRADLRHIRALHWDYDQKIHIGERVCNAQIADCVVRILRQLYDARYPIQRMLLPDVYDADDEKQMRDNNTSCFFNDTQRMYNILIDSLHYSKAGIFVYMSDGTDPTADQKTGTNTYISSPSDLDDDGNADTIAAQKSRLNNGFSILGLWAQPGDEVFVFMTDNGYYDGSFNLWNGEALYPSELNNLLNKLNPLVKVDVVMGQSYSGAFISTIAATNRTITTSCGTNETAHRNAYSYTYFLNKWTNAISTYADVSTSDYYNDAFASPLELYNSANTWIQSQYSEHPQYSSTPSNFGEKHSIDGFKIPYITGSDYLSTNTYNTFTIHDCPDSPYLYAWMVGNNASIISYTDSTLTVSGSITGIQYYVPSTRVTLSMIVDGYMHYITKPIDSVWKPGSYIGNNYITGGNGIYSITTHPGAYGYYWQCMNPDWQITSQNGGYALVTEGYTVNPVYFIVSFNEPQGGAITLVDQVN